MQVYRVRGADGTTGRDVERRVQATSTEQAERIAQSQGIMISKVELTKLPVEPFTITGLNWFLGCVRGLGVLALLAAGLAFLFAFAFFAEGSGAAAGAAMSFALGAFVMSVVLGAAYYALRLLREIAAELRQRG